MNSDIEEIKNRLNIVDVLRDYIRLEKAGANYRGLCPFHNEKTPSFMVSEDRQMWHCFGCQKGGDVFSFVQEIEGLEFREALKILAEKAGVELQKMDPRKVEEKNKTIEILQLATKVYEYWMENSSGGKKALKYLTERSINQESIKEFRLGYAPQGWDNILKYLIGKGYKPEEIEKAGLVIKKDNGGHYDRFRDRIMFPISDLNGKIIGYSARVAPGGDESQAKYVNTPETEVYHKSRILYGIDKAKQETRQANSVFLVEGNVDVVASFQAGIKNTVAVSGTALTVEQINIIKRYAEKVKMCFDMDQAGENATKKSIKLCLENDLGVEVVTLPEGKDAADLAQKDPEKLKQAVENSVNALEYFFKKTLSKFDKKTAEGKKMIADEMLDMIGHLTSDIEVGHWLKKLGESLEIKENILTENLKKVKMQKRVSSDSQAPEELEAFYPKAKSEVLERDLLGLMLVYSSVWKEMTQKIKEGYIFGTAIVLAVEKGIEADFDFDQFLKLLGDQNHIREMEKIFFEKKYRLGLNNVLEEIEIKEPLLEMKNCLKEIEKEKTKEELNKISKDLKKAEENKDFEAIKFLRSQFKEISEKLKS